MNISLLEKIIVCLQKDPAKIMDNIWQSTNADIALRNIMRGCNENIKEQPPFYRWAETDIEYDITPFYRQGYMIVSDYIGEQTPPEGTLYKKGIPQVLRPTDKLLTYLQKHLKL